MGHNYLDLAGDAFDPLDPRLFPEDVFWPTLTHLRENCPVFRSEGNQRVVVTRYDDITRTAQDWKTFSSTTGVPPVPWEQSAAAFKILPTEADAPYHRQIRDLLNPYFTPKSALQLEPVFRELAGELLDDFCEDGRCEFVSQFAEILPGRAVYEGVLGAPRDDFAKVLGWVHHVIMHPNDSADVQAELVDWCETLLEGRSQKDRRHDVIDGIVQGTIDDRKLTTQERVQILVNTMVGALDTTINSLSNIVYHLATMPEISARLRTDGDVYDRAIDEFLRYEAPAPTLGRTANHDTEIAGVKVDAGSQVLLYWAAANRDPRIFDNPDTLDFDRPKNNHIAFGWGPHVCLGQHIARLELRVALQEIVRRMPGLRLAPGAQIEYRVSMSRSPLHLEVEFDPTPRRR